MKNLKRILTALLLVYGGAHKLQTVPEINLPIYDLQSWNKWSNLPVSTQAQPTNLLQASQPMVLRTSIARPRPGQKSAVMAPRGRKIEASEYDAHNDIVTIDGKEFVSVKKATPNRGAVTPVPGWYTDADKETLQNHYGITLNHPYQQVEYIGYLENHNYKVKKQKLTDLYEELIQRNKRSFAIINNKDLYKKIFALEQELKTVIPYVELWGVEYKKSVLPVQHPATNLLIPNHLALLGTEQATHHAMPHDLSIQVLNNPLDSHLIEQEQ